ncbi:MAG: prepilin-type N-terminal cleavage/methylation domain-containing protein [Candidatus Saccharimonadales bacterium]
MLLAKHKRQIGFTIVELLIVIVIIGILAAITIVAYNGIQERANFSKSQSDLSALNKAIQLYYAENGSYPSPTSGCTNGWCGWDQATDDNFIPGLVPKYIASTPQLPTSNASNNTYLYSSTNGTTYRLMRYKADTAGLSTIERTDNPLLASPAFSTTGWGYKSSNVAW